MGILRSYFSRRDIIPVSKHLKEGYHLIALTFCPSIWYRNLIRPMDYIRLLRRNSSEKNFQESLSNFKTRLLARGYPKNLVERISSEASFAGRQSALKQKKRDSRANITICHDISPKNILMHKWSLIQNQPLLRTIFKKPSITSYKRGKSLKDMLVVRAKQ